MAGWRIGDIAVERVEEFFSAGLALESQFVGFDPALFDQFPELSDMDRVDPETGRTFASIHSWLMRYGDEIILVDTASGNHKERLNPSYARFHMLDTDYLGVLKRAEVKPEDVSVVVNTHMHVDHSGWNTRLEDGRWVPTFPNARYVFGRDEYANWQPGGVTALAQPEGLAVIADSIDPIVDAEMVDWVSDGDELRPGLRFRAAPGHTSGQLVLEVTSQGETGIFTADTMHRAMQVFEPELNCAWCEDNSVAPVTRKQLLTHCAEQRALIFPAHFDRPHVGRIAHRDDGGFRFIPVEEAA
ncbi:MBL fold metallo-hydrolase [Pseudohoeflea coraliihabitans]|uniref:MBL fold metallo-hydrolase n=1 Tax=Pseudohoeflea coraliihabitans TaxID=2860393 RepID=A0ABS6WKZ5_9HYPH|nr:MBL fold metallo-hydrolase [Pseudohoeflea sp. DP4N28-3]MBW3096616.1 MBL fold metallo-hydrolase [Pseudohoeflea sp. DP4N28-3]